MNERLQSNIYTGAEGPCRWVARPVGQVIILERLGRKTTVVVVVHPQIFCAEINAEAVQSFYEFGFIERITDHQVFDLVKSAAV